MQPTTEELILDVLKKHRLVSTTELSRILFMTKPNIHYHLKKMLKKRMIEAVKEDFLFSQRPGRPELFYRLSPIAAGNNITQLCDLLLEQQKNKKKIYQYLAHRLLPRPQESTPMPILLRSLVAEMNSRAYACRWEAHKTGPIITFSNCPYAAIIDQHPDLCQMDVCLLESYLSFPVEQITRIDKKTQISNECRFSVKI